MIEYTCLNFLVLHLTLRTAWNNFFKMNKLSIKNIINLSINMNDCTITNNNINL